MWEKVKSGWKLDKKGTENGQKVDKKVLKLSLQNVNKRRTKGGQNKD